jgi:hypothetical protein
MRATNTRSLQAWLGHKNIQYTVRYTELAPERFKDFWLAGANNASVLARHRPFLASLRHQLDYVVIEDGQTIGRMYEDPHAPADHRWFWSAPVYVDPMLGIVTHGRVPSLQAS